jgi:hypothetical protein
MRLRASSASLGEIVLLSLTASLNPTLVAVTTIMLLLDRPARLMLGYLCGALLTSITLGLVIVFSFSSSSTANTTENTLSPAVDIALGVIALAIAFVLYTGRFDRFKERRSERKADRPKKEKQPPRWQRELSKGSPRATFIVGALLTLPGASYLAGLHQIHEQHYSTAVTVLVVLGFNIVMLWLLEAPLVLFLIAPDWTPSAIDRAKAWVGRHAFTFAVRGLSAIGALLIIKGIVGLVT